MTIHKCDLFCIFILKCIFIRNKIRHRKINFRIFIMNTILWEEESIFPEKIESFKKFLKRYLTLMDSVEFLQEKPFNYDPEADEFLDSDIQEYYYLWSIA